MPSTAGTDRVRHGGDCALRWRFATTTHTRHHHARGHAVALLLLLVACGDDASAPAATTSVEVTTTSSSTSTSTSTSTTSTTLPGPTPRPSPTEAVDFLLGAWRAGDRAGALTVADVGAVDALFAIAPEPPDSRGCNQPPAGFGAPTYCVYRLGAGELQVRAAERDGGWVVDQVLLSPH